MAGIGHERTKELPGVKMEELITRIATSVGVSPQVAERVVAIVLNMFRENASAESVSAIMGALPGAETLLESAGGATSNEGDGGGGMGSMLSGAMGALAGGNPLMDTLSKLQGEGLSMDQAKTAGTEIVAFAKEKAGDEAVDNLLGEIPGLSSIL